MQDFSDEGFVTEDGLTFQFTKPDTLLLKGRVRCRNGLFIDVEKFLEVRRRGDRTEVRTGTYSYHAGVEGSAARSIFRYDNAHTYVREGHPDTHHKHTFDYSTWTEKTPPEWIGEERWPHLSDVLEELRQWWETTGRHLDPGQPADV
jgi:hypothetical protein